jgi:hypothetical protein
MMIEATGGARKVAGRNRSDRPETRKHSHKCSDENSDEAEKKVRWLKRNPKTKEDVVEDIHREFKFKI